MIDFIRSPKGPIKIGLSPKKESDPVGSILRLDGRLLVEDQEAPAVGVVTACWHGGCQGRVWPIRVHDKPELRLKAWSKGKPLRYSAIDVSLGDGTLDYQDMLPGFYDAESTTTRVKELVNRVVFCVEQGGSVVVLSRGSDADRVVAELSGWSEERLHSEREAYAAHLAERAEAIGFVTLAGSPNQVVWANQFRATKYQHASEYLVIKRAELAATSRTDGTPFFKLKTAVGWLEHALPRLLTVEDAGWWVERVQTSGKDILRQVAKACRDRQAVGGRAGG